MIYVRVIKTFGCRVLFLFALAIVFVGAAGRAQAHEFWLEPSSYAPGVDKAVTITHRNGQNFKGNSYPYLTQWFERFRVHDARGTRDVQGVDGDDPAATLTFSKPGTAIVSYESNPDDVTMDWKKFTTYLKKEGLDDVLVRHRKRGLADGNVTEKYVRNAKALINVGGKASRDRVLGLPFELVVETPLAELAAGKKVTVRLLHRGKPHSGKLITVFRKSDGAHPSHVVTDQDGRVVFEVVSGEAYLLNAVVMEDPKSESKVNWFSYWASTTFKVR